MSLARDAWRRLRRNRVAMVSLVFLVVLSLLAFLTPLLPLQSPYNGRYDERSDLRSADGIAVVCRYHFHVPDAPADC